MAEETLADLFLAAGVRGQQRPRPLSMRPAWQRTPEANTPYRAPQQALADRNTVPYQRQETRNERRQQNDLAQFALQHEAARNEVNTPPGTYLGQDALEMTGLPSVARGIGHLRDQEPGQALPELALGGLGVFGMVAGGGARTPRARWPMEAPPRLPQMEAPPSPTRIFRGLKDEHDPARAALLGDRWWHTNPNVASTYAPGEGGAHVVPGVIDESTLNLARIQAEPGTNSRHIPVTVLPANIRRALPRGATYANTHEVAAAAEAAGYDGVTFAGIRDSGYANAMDGAYPGFETGDDGRVVALFNDSAVRSPFPQLPTEAPRLPNAPARLPGRATDGSVLPIRPPQPIRQSMVGGSDDLAEAAAMRPQVRSGPDAGPSQTGRASVADLRARFDPFGADNPWEVAPITEREVRQAMQNGTRETRRFDDDGLAWTRQDHINRIATLARDGWDAPIDLTSRQGVNDGVHRLAAAIVRGDDTIATRQAPAGVFGHGDIHTPTGLKVERDGTHWQVVDASNGAVLRRLPPGSTFADANAALRNARTAPDGRPVQAERTSPASVSGAGQPIRRGASGYPFVDQFFPVDDAAFDQFRAQFRPLRDAGDFTESEVPLDRLTGTNKFLSRDFENAASLVDARDGQLPWVYQAPDGRMLIMDGHNRLSAAVARGETSARVRVYRSPDAPVRSGPSGSAPKRPRPRPPMRPTQ